jgi:hypothetical protein
MDWYMEAKWREQERLNEANIARMLKAARAARQPRRANVRGQIAMWLQGLAVMLTTSPQTEWK